MVQDSCTNLQLAPNLHFLGIFFADYVSTNAPQAGGDFVLALGPWGGPGPELSGFTQRFLLWWSRGRWAKQQFAGPGGPFEPHY